MFGKSESKGPTEPGSPKTYRGEPFLASPSFLVLVDNPWCRLAWTYTAPASESVFTSPCASVSLLTGRLVLLIRAHPDDLILTADISR